MAKKSWGEMTQEELNKLTQEEYENMVKYHFNNEGGLYTGNYDDVYDYLIALQVAQLLQKDIADRVKTSVFTRFLTPMEKIAFYNSLCYMELAIFSCRLREN